MHSQPPIDTHESTAFDQGGITTPPASPVSRRRGLDRANERDVIRSVVSSYSDLRARLYCRLRFQILRQRFLDEIGQYLPEEGSVVDIGCGFGLFGLYFGITRPGIRIVGLDKQQPRIAMARAAAGRLGVRNVRFEVGDAERYVQTELVHAAYMLDILHHIPRTAAHSLLETLASNLAPGGRLVIKDIETTPGYKRWFTWALDKGMDWRAPVDYWHTVDVRNLLTSLGLSVVKHSMVDYLPYPHVIYVATKPPAGTVTSGPARPSPS